MMQRLAFGLAIVAVLWCVPAVAQVREGVQTGPVLPAPSGGEGRGGIETGGLSFDEFGAPCLFAHTVATTTEFAASGVTFEGPGGNDGGAVLNECGGFQVTGYSEPNFLAFNEISFLFNGGVPRGPETLIFSPSVDSFSLNCGEGNASVGTATLDCFDDQGTLLGSDTITPVAQLQAMAVVAPGIATCVLSFENTGGALVCDDLQFEPVAVELEGFSVER